MTAIPGAPRASELECEATILQAARAAGWRCHSERPAMNAKGNWSTPIKGDAGFPDLVLVHQRRRLVVLAELKRWPNDIEPEQIKWREAFLQAAGMTVHLWWVPEQLDAILAFLTARGPMPFPYDPTKDPSLRRQPRARKPANVDARADLDHLTFVACSVCLLPLSSHTSSELSACRQIGAHK